MMGKGYSAAYVGIILCLGNFISFLLQPILGARMDKSEKNLLPYVTALMGFVAAFCILVLRFIDLPLIVFSILYVLALCLIDMQAPLYNSIVVFYSSRLYPINYELGRAIGALGFGIVSVIIGRLMSDFSIECMPIIAAAALVVFAVIGYSFPHINDSIATTSMQENESISLFAFFKKYSWYCVSLLGFLFIALIHIMSESYFIELANYLGGDSKTVGNALLVATIVEIPFMFFFLKIYRKLGSKKILMIGALGYTLKMLGFALATEPYHMLLVQMLQCISYTFINPIQMYYAQECVDMKNMLKGQAVITAAFSLGLAAGNLLGGILITAIGIKNMLWIAFGIGILGLLVLLISVPKALEQGKAISKSYSRS